MNNNYQIKGLHKNFFLQAIHNSVFKNSVFLWGFDHASYNQNKKCSLDFSDKQKLLSTPPPKKKKTYL